MTPAKKDSPPPEKTPAAKPQPAAGGGEVSADDWREQSEPKPQPPGTGPAESAKPKAKAAPMTPAPLAFTAPPGFTAGTPITVTPYRAAGKAPIYVIGTIVNGSEEATLMTIKNQLFLPAVIS